MYKRLYLFCFFILFGFLKLFADGVSFQASAPSQVSVGERFRLTYTVNARPSEFNPPSFSNFRIISGPNQSSSSSVQIINGAVTQTISITYTYVLEAIQEGNFTIGSAKIKIDNKEYNSNLINISVVKGASAPPTSQPQQQQPAQAQGVSAEDIFVRAEVSNPNPYRGEQIVVSYKIYTRLNIAQYSFDKIPGFQGFWTEDISVEANRHTQNEVINGVTYRVGEIRRIAAFPQRSGELSIDPLELEVVAQIPVQRRRGNVFDDFFGGSFFDRYENQRLAIKSNAVKINVKPLPAQNRPSSFTGLVGNFDINAELSPTELKINDAANLIVNISGTGNIRMIEQPQIQFPQNLDAFDPNVNDNIRTARSGISGSRKFDYLLIPRTGGEFIIPAIHLSYFDPKSNRYITKKTREFTINVEGARIADGDGSLSREDFSLLADDIRFIYTRPIILSPKGSLFYRSANFYLFVFLPILLFAILLIFWHRHIQLHSNAALLKNRKAQKVAKKRLKTAERHLKNNDKTAFYDEISRTMWGYISDKLNMPRSILNKENIDIEFKDKQISHELASQFINTLDECEFARFAPGDPLSVMEEVYEKAEATIINIEKHLKSKRDIKA